MAASRRERRTCPCFSRFCLVLAVFTSLAVGQEVFSRKVSMQYNPGCNIRECQSSSNDSDSDSHNNLVHILARGKRDSLHYVWSTIGAPTVLMVHTTSTQSKLTVDWEKLLKVGNKTIDGAITVEPISAVDYSMAVIFNKIWEYEDLNDTSQLPDNKELFEPYDLSEMRWRDFNSTLNSTSLTGNFTGETNQTHMEPLFQNGTISFRIHAFKTEGRMSDLPHLQSTANQTQFDFTIDSVEPRGNMSRFAIELMFITQDKKGTHVDLKKSKSIDDEYTPGVFELFELTTAHGGADQADSYMQWKPVCYTDRKRSMGVATRANTYKLKDLKTTDLPQDTVARAYFPDLDQLQRKAVNVSFGLSKDGTYVASNYTSWTASVGYGDPPYETLSLLVIVVISTGLGIPVVIILFGGLFVCCRQKDKSAQEKKTESDEYNRSDDYSRVNGSSAAIN